MEAQCCIGFDADFTLITYNIKRFADLQYTSLSRCMMRLGLPEDLLSEEFTQRIEYHIETGLVADFKTGCVIKLGEANQVLKAFYGFQELSAEAIHAFYPTSQYRLKNEEIDYVEGDRYLFLSHFGYGGLHVFRVVVELIQRGKVHMDFAEIGRKIREAVVMNYCGTTDGQPAGFYQEFYDNPSAYLHPASEELKTTLRKLKERHTLVLISNSERDYVQFVFQFCFGPSWKCYFDYVVYNAKKPRFFMSQTPFQQLSVREFSNGNSAALKQLLDCTEFWYVGDHYVGDVEASKKAGWRSCCVLYELVAEFGYAAALSDRMCPESVSSSLPRELAYTEKWGSHFLIGGIRTHWWAFLREHADVVGGTIDGVARRLLALSKPN